MGMGQLQELESDVSTPFLDDDAKAGLVGGRTNKHRRGRFPHCFHLFTRRLDRRRLIIFVVLLVALVVVVLELTHLFLFKAPIPVIPLIPAEFCTTWPVSDDDQPYAPIPHEEYERPHIKSVAPSGGWKKPSGIKVIGLIFYGRRRNVDILDCYLLQNLASEGGYFDEVQFIVHTNKEDDKAYLDELVSQREGYRIVDVGDCQGTDYSCMWDTSVEKDTIYIKIDDDIVGALDLSKRPLSHNNDKLTVCSGVHSSRCDPTACPHADC